MNPSRLFILRPVATSLLMVAIMLAGIVAYRELALSALPEVDYPTIQVLTFYPGASPDVVTSSITAPLERQFGQMPGLRQMSSTSSGGASVLTLQFALTIDEGSFKFKCPKNLPSTSTQDPDHPTCLLNKLNSGLHRGEAHGEALIDSLHLLQKHQIRLEGAQTVAQFVNDQTPVELRQALVDVERDDAQGLLHRLSSRRCARGSG